MHVPATNHPIMTPRLFSVAAKRSCYYLAAFALAALAGCSGTTEQSNKPAPSVTASGTSSTMTPNAGERLAEAKTVAVGFFEAQAVNDFDKALAKSSGAAATSIKWAQAVNTSAAANGTPYQVPTIVAPNIRVQIDQLTGSSGGQWTASGFVELSFRPGPVASTTTQPPAPGTVTIPPSSSTYVADLVFSSDGDHLRLHDYRLDDTPYPVSQLFLEMSAKAQAGSVSGVATLGHRDLDGSVQYVSEFTALSPAEPVKPTSTSFMTQQANTTTTTVGITGQVLADAVATGATGHALSVFPGLFPGSAGTLRVGFGLNPARDLDFTVPDFAALTPSPVNAIAKAQTASTTTSLTSTTSTTTPTTTSTTAVAPITATTAAPPTSPSNSTTTTRPATTTSSTSTTIKLPI